MKAAKPAEPQKEKRLPAAKRRQLEARQDVDDFRAEYCMLKKVKKGKMSEVCLWTGLTHMHHMLIMVAGNLFRSKISSADGAVCMKRQGWHE